MTPSPFSSAWAALCLGLLCACATQPESSASEAMATRRVIVTLRAGAPDPHDATFLAQLTESANANISVLREMSGNAWVMNVMCRTDRDGACEDALQRLRASRWIATIEPDGRELKQ